MNRTEFEGPLRPSRRRLSGPRPVRAAGRDCQPEAQPCLRPAPAPPRHSDAWRGPRCGPRRECDGRPGPRSPLSGGRRLGCAPTTRGCSADRRSTSGAVTRTALEVLAARAAGPLPAGRRLVEPADRGACGGARWARRGVSPLRPSRPGDPHGAGREVLAAARTAATALPGLRRDQACLPRGARRAAPRGGGAALVRFGAGSTIPSVGLLLFLCVCRFVIPSVCRSLRDSFRVSVAPVAQEPQSSVGAERNKTSVGAGRRHSGRNR